jgi:DNA-binding response OmpR family regulator
MSQLEILIVEDNKELSDIYQRVIRKEGYDVVVVSSSEDALGRIKISKPSIILLDIVLPGISGLDLLQTIKSDPALEDIFVVLISGARKSSNEKSEGLELGADGYLTKPINIRELAARINAFVRYKKTIDELRKSEERFGTMINKNADGLLIIDYEGTIRFANPAARELFRHHQPLVGSVFGYPIINNKKTELQLSGKEGYDRVAELHIVELYWENRKVFLASIRDISDRKRAELALKENEAFIKGILNSLSALIAVIDSQGKIVAVNDAWKELEAGRTGKQEIFLDHEQFFQDCKQSGFSDAIPVFDKAKKGISSVLSGDSDEFEIVYPCFRDDKTHYFLMRVLPVKESQNNFVISHVNITKQILTEIELQEHKERLEQMVEKRTQELKLKVKDVERFNSLFVGRELRIKELKDEVKELKANIAQLRMNMEN